MVTIISIFMGSFIGVALVSLGHALVRYLNGETDCFVIPDFVKRPIRNIFPPKNPILAYIYSLKVGSIGDLEIRVSTFPEYEDCLIKIADEWLNETSNMLSTANRYDKISPNSFKVRLVNTYERDRARIDVKAEYIRLAEIKEKNYSKNKILANIDQELNESNNLTTSI